MPRGGMCPEGATVGTDGCTWKSSATVDVLYGVRDLLPLGWNACVPTPALPSHLMHASLACAIKELTLLRGRTGRSRLTPVRA